MKYLEELKKYEPKSQSQIKIKEKFIELYNTYGDGIFERNDYGHVTASSIILNKKMDKMLMIYHNIYKHYGWQGGHNDGNSDPLDVAIDEACEETGLTRLIVIDKVYSLDILPVKSHYKNGFLVESHDHYNFTYVFIAYERDEIYYNEKESSDIKWVDLEDLDKVCKEYEMLLLYKRVIKEFKEDEYGLSSENQYVVERLTNN